MPRSQVANTGVYGFGAKAGTATPVAADEVIRFRARRGSVLNMRFINEGSDGDGGDLHVTVQVAPDADGDPDTFVATSATNNLSVITDAVIGARQFKDFELGLREITDSYMRVLATGGRQAELQIVGDQNLDIIDISN